ncbi:NAD-dependent epimerase/dehydratase family protein, partial [Candidatus Woesearchaeota archaeon]|nr:NAD-dependent epimerase/dehydratase family protein [Candidatus Woesearchaeota archaeon]
VFSSSAAVYGDNDNLPLKEEEPYKPLSPYAQSKAEAEKLCYEYLQRGLKTCALRFFNVYGSRQDSKSPYSGVISIFLEKAKNNEEITIYGNGKNTRDFIYISDLMQANILAMKKGKGIYNAASGTEITIKELAEKIIEITNSNSDIVHKEERKGDIKKSRADITKIKQLGYSPKINIEQGLKELIDN